MGEFIALDIIIFLILVSCIGGALTLFWKYYVDKKLEKQKKKEVKKNGNTN